MTNINERLWDIVSKKCNNAIISGSSLPMCTHFFVGSYHVGIILPEVAKYLLQFPDVFITDTHNNETIIKIKPNLSTFEEKSTAVAKVFSILRDTTNLAALKCWRNEYYGVFVENRSKALLKVERAASTLLGVVKYGVHVNGYTVDKHGNCEYMWIGQRSLTKLTYPGLMDNMAGGGLNFDYDVLQCARNECQEEASVPLDLLAYLKSVGTLSLFFEDYRGMNPEVMYCYDLILPSSFEPVNSDGEVSHFLKVHCSELKHLAVDERFKPTSALVLIDFLIRHGFITPDDDPHYSAYGYWMHSKLPFD